MAAGEAGSIDALLAAAGLDGSAPVQITTVGRLTASDPTLATLARVIAGEAVELGRALRKYGDDVAVAVVSDGLSVETRGVAALRAAGLPARTIALGLPAVPASEVRFDPVGLRGVIHALRDPQSGCPWDLEQDHQSLRPHLLEETYEVLQALDANDPRLLREELGDLFMQIVLHAEIADQAGEFDLDEVSEGIREKLVRRHPHVFGDVDASSADEVTANWDKIKAQERDEEASALDGVPRALPALQRAQSLTGRAERRGFFWPTEADLLANITDEVREIAAADGAAERRAEFGDLVFALADLARRQGVPLEDAVRETAEKFERRYRGIEAQLRAQGRSMEEADRTEQLERWESVKRSEG